MSRHGRYAFSIIAATLTAVVLPLSLGFATSASAQTPAAGAVRLDHVDTSALPEVAATVSVTPVGAERLDSDSFTVTAGSNKIPTTVVNIDTSKLQVVLVVDPGPNAESATTVRLIAADFVGRVMPKGAVTVVSGGATPKVVLGANHDLSRTERAIGAIKSGPASLLDSIALALFQRTDDPPNTAVVAIAAEAKGTDTAAWTIAANAANAQRSIDVVLPSLATVPKLLEPLTSVGAGRVAPAPNTASAVAAVDQISSTLNSRYLVRFKLPKGTSSKADFVLGVDTGSTAGLQSVALNIPPKAASRPTPSTTPSKSPARTTGTVPKAVSTPTAAGDSANASAPTKARADGRSESSPLPWFIAAAVLLLLLGAFVPVQRRRRIGTHSAARRERRLPPIDADHDREPKPTRLSALRMYRSRSKQHDPVSGSAQPPAAPKPAGAPEPTATHQPTALPPPELIPPVSSGEPVEREPISAPEPADTPIEPPEPEAPEPAAAPAAAAAKPVVRATIARSLEDGRSGFGANGGRQPQKPGRFVPATGQARLDRRRPNSVADERIDRGTAGAGWWMYQRPDTGHESGNGTASASASGESASGNGADDPEPARPSHQAPPAPPKAEGTETTAGAGRDNSFMVPTVVGAALLLTAAVLGHWVTDVVGPWLIIPGAMLLALGLGRLALQSHPDEPWVGRLIVYGVGTKLGMCYFRYFGINAGWEGRSDSIDYDTHAIRYVLFWTRKGPNPNLKDLHQTNFIRWFTGVVYYIFGSNFLTGFLIFGLIAVTGSYLWYRATVNAVPFLDRRLYLTLVMFVPSIVFWPAVIGKEALMQFGIGAMALGTAHLMRARLIPGLLVCLGGGWLLWVVRPHLLAIVALAGAAGYLLGRVRQHDGSRGSLLGRPIGVVVVIVLVIITVNQGASFLGLEDLSVNSIDNRLSAQTAATSNGDSKFESSGGSLNPLKIPQGALTVLLRPLPWEVETSFQLLSSLESLLLACFIALRFQSIKAALANARIQPYLMYCWILLILYCMAFASFANFGLLVRQRSLVLPALYVLLSVDPRLAAKPDPYLHANSVPESPVNARA